MKNFIFLLFAWPLSILLYAQSGEDNFKTICSACHTVGKGQLVGPDLKGAHKKYPEKWLVKWIRSSQTMVNEGDKKAVDLFNQFNQIPMPDNPQFSDADIKGIIAFIKSESGDTGEKAALANKADSTPEAKSENIPVEKSPQTVNAEPDKTSIQKSDQNQVANLPMVVTEKITHEGNGGTFLFIGLGLGGVFFLAVLAILKWSIISLSNDLKKKCVKDLNMN